MPDIAMCLNKDCAKNMECYRFVAKPCEHWQSFHPFKPDLPDKGCDDFIKATKQEIIEFKNRKEGVI